MVLPQENEQRRSPIGRADLMLAFPGFSRSGMRRIMVLPQENEQRRSSIGRAYVSPRVGAKAIGKKQSYHSRVLYIGGRTC